MKKNVIAVALGGMWAGGVGIAALTAILMQAGMDNIVALVAASLIIGAPSALVTSAAMYGASKTAPDKQPG